MGFLSWEIRVAFPGETQLRQSRTTQRAVHAGFVVVVCLFVFSISIIHRTLTWATGSLTCAQMLTHATAHGGCTDTVRVSALKVDSERKFPCCTGESNLRRQRAGSMIYQLSYIPAQHFQTQVPHHK